MTETILQFLHFDRFGWRSLADILILTVIIYQILRIFQGTRAVRMLYGILVLVVAYILTTPGRILELPAVNRVLGALILFTPLAIVVLFQNHIRRMLAIFGSNPLAGLGRSSSAEKMVDEIVLAAATLASKKHGALIVLERDQGLRTFAETGIILDAEVSYDLLTTIFMPNTPLHDGAVILSEGRIKAAACFLPLSTGAGLGREFGSRHRAAIGITEETDAVAIVVSEQTGTISLVQDGRMRRGLEPRELRSAVFELLTPPTKRLKLGKTTEHMRAADEVAQPSEQRIGGRAESSDGAPMTTVAGAEASDGASQPQKTGSARSGPAPQGTR